MAWKVQQIKNAFEHGQDIGASHMIVAYDSFDYENYPIYVTPGKDPKDFFPTNGDKVEEVYSYAIPWEDQASQGRVMNTDWTPGLKLNTPGTIEEWRVYAQKLEEMLETVGIRRSMLEAIRTEHFHG